MFVYHVLDALHPKAAGWFARTVLHAERATVRTARGVFWIDPLSYFGRQLALGQEHEPETAQVLREHLGAGSTFVDLGAHEGYFTVQAAKLCGKRGKVYAIEPQPRCDQVIRVNCRLNDCTNVAVLRMAVSDHVGHLTLYPHPATNSGATSISRRARGPVRRLEVPCTTLEALFDAEGTGDIDLLKVDIEGAEYEAILGSGAVFRRGQVKALCLEYHPQILEQRKLRAGDIHTFLSACGYESRPSGGHCVYVLHQ
jgi:FkbM family methyltransferase